MSSDNAIQLTAKTGRASIGETTCSYSVSLDRQIEQFADLNQVADLFIGRQHWCRFEVLSEAQQRRIFGDDPPEVFEGLAVSASFHVYEQKITLTLKFQKADFDIGLFAKFAQQTVTVTITPGKKVEAKPKPKGKGSSVEVQGEDPVDAEGQRVLEFDEQKRARQLDRKKLEDLQDIAKELGIAAGPAMKTKADYIKAILEEEAKSAVDASA